MSHGNLREAAPAISMTNTVLPGYYCALSVMPKTISFGKSSVEFLREHAQSPAYRFNPNDKDDLIPRSYRGIFENKKANIVGLELLKDDFLHRDTVIHNYYSTEFPSVRMFDADDTKLKHANQGGSAFIFSPGYLHTEQIYNLAQKGNSDGIYVDKPMCVNEFGINVLDRVAKTTNKPIYVGDTFFFTNMAALRLMGVPMPYQDAITIDMDNSKDKKFTKCIENATPFYKHEDIESVVAKINETGDPELIKRPWLDDYKKGGGVLNDLQTHISNLLNLMGLELNRVDTVSAWKSPCVGTGIPGFATPGMDIERRERGQFRRCARNEAEDRVIITGKLNKTIPAYLECAQYMKERENYIIIAGMDGTKIRCNTDIFNRKVELLDRDDNVLAKARVCTNPYPLMIHHAQTFFDENKGQNASMFFDVNKKTMQQIIDLKSKIYLSNK